MTGSSPDLPEAERLAAAEEYVRDLATWRQHRAAAEFTNLAPYLLGLAQRIEMQDAVDYDQAERGRIENLARALLGAGSSPQETPVAGRAAEELTGSTHQEAGVA